MDIGNNVIIAKTVKLDTSINPKGIHIGDNTMILRGVTVLAHDYFRGKNGTNFCCETYIGRNCVIDVNSIILPGVRIGEHCVVGAGSVVTKNTPPHTVVAGNPAKVIKEGITVSDNYQIME